MAKARKSAARGSGGAGRKSKAKGKGKGKSGGFEVEEQGGDGEEAAGPGATLETALIYVTFLALVVGLILAQMDLSSTYGKGMFGG